MVIRFWLSCICICYLLGAALAQGADLFTGNEPATGADEKVLTGYLQEVNLAQRQITVALRVRVTDPNAPGKVPDEFARQAALLQQRLTQAEKDGNTLYAQELRGMIRKLLCWRELVQPITTATGTRLIGTRPVPLTTIVVGMRVLVPVAVTGEMKDGQLPAQGVMVGDARILDGQERNTGFRIQGISPQSKQTFLQVVGQVASLNPLTLRVDNATIQVETKPQFSALQNGPITAKDLQPGLRLFAVVRMKSETEIERIPLVDFLFYQPATPIPQRRTQ